MGKEYENQNVGENHYCSGCGNCCRIGARLYPELKGDSDSDVCKNFQEPNICKIYEDRPIFCRTDEMAEILVKDGTFRSIEHHTRVSMNICKKVEVIPPEEVTYENFMDLAMKEIHK